MRFIDRYRICKKVIKQMKAGEWVAVGHGGEIYRLKRGNRQWWVANGAWFCDSHNPEGAAGLLFRHWVWWAAARSIKAKAYKGAKEAERQELLSIWMD